MSDRCDEKGTSKKKDFYVNNEGYAAGDANVQPTESLDRNHLRTFKNELHAVIDSWRTIYGPLPWAKLAQQYNYGDVKAVERIEKARNEIDLKVTQFKLN